MATVLEVKETDNINLHVDSKVFTVSKEVLCAHSDYFKAMFSGKYIENEKKDITIDVVDKTSMDLVVKFIKSGARRLDLSNVQLATIGTLAMAANFLQITELVKQVMRDLDHQLSLSTWVEIMVIAENASFNTLEQLAAAHGLLSFKDMKPEYIPNIQKLFWYLSHPFLNTDSELDVFKFGYKWILHPETCPCADILLIILNCLDVSRLSIQDLKEISILLKDCETSLAAKVVECLKMLLDNKMEISIKVILEYMETLRETFSENVYNEVYKLVKYSKKRNLVFVPVVPMWGFKNGEIDYAPCHMYKFKNCNFQKWIEISNKDLWGWSLTSWGANKLVQVCGEHGRGTGKFLRDVKVYDTLRNVWTWHGVQLPRRRHAGVTIAKDLLFIIGGIGEYRVMQDTTIVYNMKKRFYWLVQNFPDAIQSPAVCTHYGSVYASGHKNIYKFEHNGAWVAEVITDIRTDRMVSFKDHIYCSQNYFSTLYRFRPGFDNKLETVTRFRAPPALLCNNGSEMVIFNRSANSAEELIVEDFTGPCMCPEGTCLRQLDCGRRVLWYTKKSDFVINDVAGGCSVVMDLPSTTFAPCKYHQQNLARYAHITYDK